MRWQNAQEVYEEPTPTHRKGATRRAEVEIQGPSFAQTLPIQKIVPDRNRTTLGSRGVTFESQVRDGSGGVGEAATETGCAADEAAINSGRSAGGSL